MALQIKGTILSPKIPLDQSDPDGDTYVVFRRPRQMEAELLSDLWVRHPIQWEEGGRKITQLTSTSWAQVDREQVKLCLVESNILDENGKPLFKPGYSCRAPDGAVTEQIERRFLEAWGKLDPDVADEICTKLRLWHHPFARSEEERALGEEFVASL